MAAFVFIWNLRINLKSSIQNYIKEKADSNANTWCLNFLITVYNEKCTQSTFFQRLKFKLDQMTDNDERKAQNKTINFGTCT